MTAEPTTSGPTSAGAATPPGGPERSERSALIALLPAAGAGAALAALASRLGGAAGPETALLAATAALVLAGLALAGASPRWLAAGALTVTLAAWALPAGPTRGAAMGLLLVALLATAATGRPPLPVTWPWRGAALALAIQALARPDALLSAGLAEPGPWRLLALALLSGAAAGLLARRRGALPALVAATGALLLEGFLGPAGALTLAALAAAEELAAGEPTRGRRVAAGVALAAALAAALTWSPALGLALSLATVAHRGPRGLLPSALLALAAAAAILLLPAARDPLPALGRVAWLPLAVPAAVASRRLRPALFALLLALLAGRAGEGLGNLAPAVALLALALPAVSAARRLQAVWSGAWAGATLLLAAYPWMRREPAADALALLGLSPGWTAVAAVCLTLAAIAGAARLAAGRRAVPDARGRRAVALVGGVAVAVAALAALPPPGTDLMVEPRRLDDGQPRFTVEPWEPLTISSLVVDSHLSWGILATPGRPVAVLHLVATDGTTTELMLRGGLETGEWAARRPDVAARDDLVTPPPWRSRIGAEGWAANRYRARFELAAPIELRAVRVSRAGGLPGELALTVLRLEVRP